ncbi:HD domain-containing protein [Chitinophaga sp. CF418]|uniref:HD domain-containing protein n=1 Tax=Chitinophaga sp. CF418 TaxID=1855287 RepID=UPI0009201888|nr:HD domain-containing protein [Chitinophaga sp. CF418]SHM77607.1 HD domain-containing protein [Chitinophaga sp. CF418]
MELTNTEYLAEKYVVDLFTRLASTSLVYHNLSHTERVVARSMEIADHYGLNGKDRFILSIAAWFHDTGHLVADIELHEQAGVRLMKSFFIDKEIDEALIDTISECIMATKWPPAPKTLLEEIICDADTYHFGTKEFEITDELVKKEFQLRTKKNYANWCNDTLRLLKAHRFFTSYCRDKLVDGKEANIAYLEAKIRSN